MAAAAVTSPACPLRRSSRLTSRRPVHDDDPVENELTPRALRALKRQRLPPHLCPRPKRRRKENLPLPAAAPVPDRINDPPPNDVRPHLSLPVVPDLPSPPPPPSPSPLTPLTPSPESSPSLPGHDRHSLPPSPPPDPDPRPPSADTFAPPPLPPPLDPSLDSLIPFDGLHPQYPSVQIPPPCPPPPPPQLQPLELQDQFHSFSQQPLYVPPPLFVRDREINIWKLACQERVDCLLRRYGIDYIKALVKSEARTLSQDFPSSPSSSHTKFRLYTPASYTYSSTSWGSTSRAPKAFPLDDDADEPDPAWPIDDADWADADVDMEDDDEDDYEDDDDAAEGDPEREAQTTLETIAIPNPKADAIPPVKPVVDESRAIAKTPDGPDTSAPSHPPPQTADTALQSLTPPLYLPPPLTPPSLPPLSSLHVPLLSEPPRAFMGRGTPPDRRRLIEWSSPGSFATNGVGPPLYLSPVPQSQPDTDVGVVPMSVDAPMPPPSQHSHAHGEWTSFLFSVLEGDNVGVGVGASVATAPQASEPAWYELGLGSVANDGLELPLSHPHPHAPLRTPTVEQPVEEGSNSSSTLRFALG